MKDCKKNRLSRYVVAALAAGMFSMVPVAYALPVQDTTHTNTSGTGISTVASQMNITGSAANNVMNWQTFSIANGETVQFDAKNYLNLVRGTFKSEINGALNGTGNIYLINPNGILFGSTAQVNVGNLVASTRAIDSVDADGFATSGVNPLATAATAAAGDIVNLGKLQTASLMLEGNNITIQNAADITSDGSTPLTSAVTAKAAGIITVGHKVTETTTRSFTINGTATDKTVHDYANDTYAGSGYTASKLDGATNAVKESMLVDNVYDLQNMDAKLSGNYMLSGDIAASETSSWNTGAGFSPVGNATNTFTGTFDGANHTINGLYINRPTTYNVGLFGYVNGGAIQNVGLVGGSITGKGYIGGVAGYNTNDGTITNVYNTGTVSGDQYTGGVVGYNSYSTITKAYNTGLVSCNQNTGGVAGGNDGGIITHVYNTGVVCKATEAAGGVVGSNSNEGTIMNVYNMGAVSGGGEVGGVAGINGNQCIIANAYNTGAVSGLYKVGGITGYNVGTITNVYNTGAVSGVAQNIGGVVGEDYGTITNALWANDVGGTPTTAVGNVADPNTVKGETLANMKKAATYSSWTGTNAVSSVGNAGTAWRIYEGNTTPLLTSFFKGVVTVTGLSNQSVTYNGTTQKADLSGATYDPNNIDASHILAGSGRNAGTYSAIYSDQQGYDLVNTNTLTINPKTITGSLASGYSFDKVYDGTTTAYLGNGYTLDGVVAGDTVSLTAAKGFYDSSIIGDRIVTFSGFSINDGNYLLSMADSLSGTGKITSGSLERNYQDALAGIGSYFGANPSDGYTIFRGAPEDYVPRAVTKNNGQSYQVGVSQVTQTWYNGPTTITIINGGIALPKDILLGSIPDTRTVVIKGSNSYEI